MSDENPIDAAELLRLWRPYWLPPRGHGNGLDALFWVELARIPEHLAPEALAVLAVEAIPAWVAPLPADPAHPHARPHPHGRAHGRARESGEREVSLSVATIAVDAAQELLMRILAADAHAADAHDADAHAADAHAADAHAADAARSAADARSARTRSDSGHEPGF